MNAKLFKQTSLVVMMSAVLSGCGAFSTLDEVVPDNTQKYRKAETMPPLDVPPDLSTVRINDDIAGTDDSTATYSEFEEAASNPLAAKYNLTPEKKPSLAGEGRSRHLVVPGDREVTWQRIQEFWANKGLEIDRIDGRIGLMDTVTDADGYAYRVRMERGDTSKMAEIYLNATDETQANSQKNEATLRDMADYLGSLYQEDVAKVEAQKPAPAPEETAQVFLMDDENGQQSLVVEQDFQTVWRRVGRVLDSKGFAVEDRDRSRGYYFVRYIDPFKEIEEDDEGFFSSLAFWRDDAEKNPQEYYYIKMNSEATDTRVMVLDAEENRTSSDTAKRLLNLIQEQLAP
ncbi:Outer membrane protein NlpB [Methylophaga thiooxydans]|uniref:Outer membrane protein NlpB n=1 Tax=Methylophaga thiooxydans TaxID=392484 RepID=A0A0A0BF69_9GAMM|nr:outer membrane protein assembly factor BamC [Methylophaga thiooxydans]KGM06307.1 Outer membrane protein NlpB [Methylophaga thiooxydans]